MPIEKINLVMQNVGCINKNQRIIAAVSGGPDSLCLANILIEENYNFVIAHFDHGIRKESSLESRLVQDFASEKGIQCILERANVPLFARDNHMSIEEAARELRYKFLYKAARNNHAEVIVLGHTADDQVETILMHLLRGTGLDGLSGMDIVSRNNRWGDDIRLLRPLLGIWRFEVDEYCKKKKLEPIQDSSNKDSVFHRNRIRLELIPLLVSYNPQIKSRLITMAEIIRSDSELFTKIINENWKRIVIGNMQGKINVNIHELRKSETAIQRGIIRKVIQIIATKGHDINYQMVNQVMEALTHPPKSGHIKLSKNIYVIFKSNTLQIYNSETLLEFMDLPQLFCGDKKKIPIPGKVDISEKWEIILEIKENSPEKLIFSNSKFEAYFGLFDLKPNLYVRCAKPGDRIFPLNMNGHSKKISDVFLENNIERTFRTQWPLVCREEKVVWIPGYRIDDSVKVTKESKIILHIVLQRIER